MNIKAFRKRANSNLSNSSRAKMLKTVSNGKYRPDDNGNI